MDWTGGVRKRFANRTNKSNATLQKQKAHFARQRAQTPRPVSQCHPNDSYDSKPKPMQPSPATCMRIETDSEQLQSGPNWENPKTHCSSRPNISHLTTGGRGDSAAKHWLQDDTTRTGPLRGPGHRSGFIPTSNKRVLEVDESQAVFLERRRHLLKQRDWLKLSILQPVHFKFARDSSREQIGKRRKLAGLSNQQSRSAKLPQVIPPFQNSKSYEPYYMSGALLCDEVRVKVGTQAFTTQKQRSERLRSPANTSLRPPSTSLGPISEESMLLGGDEEFESHFLQSSIGAHQNIENTDPYKDAHRESSHTDHSNWKDDTNLFQTRYLSRSDDDGNDAPGLDSFEGIATEQCAPRGCLSAGSSESRRKAVSDRNRLSIRGPSDPGMQHRIRLCLSQTSWSAKGSKPVKVQLPHTDESPDEAAWTCMTGTRSVVSNTPSVMALRLSSSCDPKSRVGLRSCSPEASTPLLSTARHRGPLSTDVGSGNTCSWARFSQERMNRPLVKTTAPPLPNQATDTCVRAPARATDRSHELRLDDEMVWRAFIIGSTEALSSSPVPRAPLLVHGSIKPTSPIRHLSSCLDEMKSDRATLGNSCPSSQSRYKGIAARSSGSSIHTPPYHRINTSVEVHVISQYTENVQ